MKIYPVLRFKDAKAAHSWMEQAFGFKPHALHEDENGGVAHAQMTWGDHMIMFGDGREVKPTELYLSCDDPDALLARIESVGGAEVVRPLNDTDYGSREFGVRDPEGHVWSFGTYEP